MLRPYQSQAIEAVRAELRAGRRRVLLVSPTGSGKTQCAAEMIRAATARGNETLVVAHRRELVYQVRDRLLRDHGIEAGLLMAGHARRDQHPVQVASIQTLMRRDLPPARLLICDEAHHAAAKSWQTLLNKLPGSVVVGLTATPWRLDDRGLRDTFEAAVVAATPPELLEQGYLCQAVGHAYVAPDFGEVASKGGDYDPIGLSLAYARSRVLGDIVERWFQHVGPGTRPSPEADARTLGARTILFASSTENSQDLISRFRARGISAEHLDYKVPQLERRRIIDRVRSGETRVIANVGILGEGVDVPELECAILARPTKSLAVYLQQVGRVLRPAPGKTRAIIHDHANCVVTHGFWDEERDYSLTASKEKTPGAAPVKQCPECFCCCPAKCLECPECGYEFPPPEPQDEDDAHKEVALEELRGKVGTKREMEELKESLFRLCMAKGLRPGFAVHRFLEKFPAAQKPWGLYRRIKEAQGV